MNKNKNQSGFAHIAIIIILAVALLGTLGFVFWQNFMQPKTVVVHEDKEKVNAPTETLSTKKPVTEDKNTLTIEDWGIKGIYQGKYPVKYSISNVGSNSFIDFTSDNLVGGCSGFRVGQIGRYMGDEPMRDGVVNGVGYSGNETIGEFFAKDNFTNGGMNKHIGNNYYLYKGPMQGCYQSGSNEVDPIADTLTTDMYEFFGTLEAI